MESRSDLVSRDWCFFRFRSNTTPSSPNVESLTDARGSLRMLQSESLRRACIYISQRAVVESVNSVQEEEKQNVRFIGDEKGACLKQKQ